MRWIFALGLMAAIGSAAAAEVAGVKLEDRATLQAGGPELVLNGAGVRTRFVIKVYVAGLYLGERKTAAADAIALGGPKRVSMTMLRELKADQLVNALNEGMEKNNPPVEMAKLKPQVGELTQIMTSLGEAKKGDVIALDFLPETGTRVALNGEARGKPIAGADFYRALLRVWLGDNPVEESLKKALLGQP
ncbi:MAG TPA: chalcone isomerase family protein [Burkholderiales bacterium]